MYIRVKVQLYTRRNYNIDVFHPFHVTSTTIYLVGMRHSRYLNQNIYTNGKNKADDYVWSQNYITGENRDQTY